MHKKNLRMETQFVNNFFYLNSSLKTENNLKVVKELPLESLMIETDAPWCEIRQTHASSQFIRTKFLDHKIAKKPDKWSPGCIVKGRNEPVFLQ